MKIKRLHAVLFVVLMLLFTNSCQRTEKADTSQGVSWTLAEHRKKTISKVRYELVFTIPDSLNERIHGKETVSFILESVGQPLVFDFNEQPESVVAVRKDGEAVLYEFVNGHIVIQSTSFQKGENEIEIDFLAGESSLNRNKDFLYTLFVPDRASFAFPCFDQPNLKARYRLTLKVPISWRAAANGVLIENNVADNQATFVFAETKPISTYLFSFVAGEFSIVTANRSGRTMNMYHRETDAQKVTRNREVIFDLHDTALNWLEEYTGIPYPFGKFDFVLIPSFQYGGMEHPGAILYRASSLFLDESATQNQLLRRASLIAHETAHMWFGDMVTMNWFDDVWTKEVFANFMAAKIVNPTFPQINHDLRFLLAHYPAAYSVDRTKGANPIRQELDNMKEAGTLYGAIIYQKAPIVMKHLENLMGKETLRDGLREYLNAYKFDNAAWPDLINILAQRSNEDLTTWSDIWVDEPGRPKITIQQSLDTTGNITSLTLTQSDPFNRGRRWNQRLSLLLSYSDTVQIIPVHFNTFSTEVNEAVGLMAPDFILANGHGTGYGLFEFIPDNLKYLLQFLPVIKDPIVRGAVWISLWEALLEGQVVPDEFLQVALNSLKVETSELIIQRIVGYLTNTYWRFTPERERISWAPQLEELLWSLMQQTPVKTLKPVYFNAFRSIVLTDSGLKNLERIWEKELKIAGLSLSENVYSTIALQLTVRQVPGWDQILKVQHERITNPDRKERFAFVMPAMSADQSVRDAFFESLKDAKNREHEPWVLEALNYLHHPLRAAQSEKYIKPSLELLQEIQRTGDIFFPKRWLDVTLGGQQSEQAADIVHQFIDSQRDYPPRLMAKILQSADELFRAADVLSKSSANTAAE